MASGAASLLTTPLRADDFLELVNPLWSRRQLWGRVEAVRRETPDVATLTIRPGRGWREHRPGQYVGTAVRVAGVWRHRPYSVSSAPGRPDGCFQITVKAARDGRVSRRLVFEAAPGTAIRLDSPAGEFVLPEEVPERVLFLTAGSGITPVMSMLRHLALRDAMPDVVLLHSARTPEDVIFGAELRALAGRFPRLRLHECHTRPARGTVDPDRARSQRLAGLLAVCPDWSRRSTWACGPSGLLAEVETLWSEAGVADRLRVERFHPAVASPAVPGPGGSGGGGGASVHFTRSGRRVATDGATPLLHAGESAGVLMPSGCRMGICRGCVARLGAGRVRDLRTGVEHGEAGELVQTCVSAAAGDVDIDL
ncbi:ferredoxin reductase [Frankia sp. CNm7]|uniref:Ferredoxin reductase n=1 Tax=Frankia nepalensis TaxID=1836974 RepID=A0A937RF91_9ACTN|nr:ferredoxin reductase [Frankia nepalensis]MBL7510047.1 ferredoxin reductase [Frankia nepalensis]MBL7517543.1 ferredoxin reductase [Frankia nepalensis]MBL7631068.1 ferredoxin reductase [Frankia nepalensis]